MEQVLTVMCYGTHGTAWHVPWLCRIPLASITECTTIVSTEIRLLPIAAGKTAFQQVLCCPKLWAAAVSVQICIFIVRLLDCPPHVYWLYGLVVGHGRLVRLILQATSPAWPQCALFHDRIMSAVTVSC